MSIKKYWWILLLIGIIFWITYPKGNPSSVETKVDSVFIKTIDHRIDTVFLTIEKVKMKYEENRNTILNNTTNEDYMFFLKYIQDNSTRLDSINNVRPT